MMGTEGRRITKREYFEIMCYVVVPVLVFVTSV